MHYTGKEFADLKKRPPAKFEGALVALLFVAWVTYQGATPKPFLTLTDPGLLVWDITVMGYMLKCAQDVREQVAGNYWAKGLVTTAIAAFGGVFLAPLVVCHLPVPLREETFGWFLILAWYVTHHLPCISAKWCQIARSGPGWVILTVCFGVVKTHLICASVELAGKAVEHETLEPHSRYFGTACMAPLLCGFLGGAGGAFLPFDKGLRPIEEGKKWPLSAAFFATAVYYCATRWLYVDTLNAKLAICMLRILGDLFPGPRASVVACITGLLYRSTNVRSACEPEGKETA